MANSRTFSNSDFASVCRHPTTYIFVVPVICLAIFHSLQEKLNHDVRQIVQQHISQDESFSLEKRHHLTTLLESMPLSTILQSKDPRWASIRDAMTPANEKYFLSARLAIYLCWGCLLLPFAMHGAIWLIGKYVQVSPQAYWTGVDLGFSLIKLFGVALYLLQSTLIVWLVLWFALYFLHVDVGNVQKNVVMIVVFAPMIGCLPATLALVELFKHTSQTQQVEGILVLPEHAPALWDRVLRLCHSMEAHAPDHIIAGVACPTFSTNAPLLLQQPDQQDTKRLKGRTLYLNLALLKHLTEEQLQAILIADLHFFQDGSPQLLFKITQLNDKFNLFQNNIRNNPFLSPVHYFGTCLHAAIAPTSARHSQTMRLEADKVSGKFTSNTIAAEAIVRSTLWYDLFHQAECYYIKHESPLEQVETKWLVESSYARRLEWYLLDFDPSIPANEGLSLVPYPSLQSKLAAVESSTNDRQLRSSLRQPLPETAMHVIDDSASMEERLWEQYERHFRENHRHALLFRYLPATAEERAFVESYFPPGELTVRGETPLAYDCEKVSYALWDQPIYYHELYHMSLDRFGERPKLVFYIRRGGRKSSVVLLISTEPRHQEELKYILTAYSDRSDAAVAYQNSKPSRTTSLWKMVEDELLV